MLRGFFRGDGCSSGSDAKKVEIVGVNRTQFFELVKRNEELEPEVYNGNPSEKTLSEFFINEGIIQRTQDHGDRQPKLPGSS